MTQMKQLTLILAVGLLAGCRAHLPATAANGQMPNTAPSATVVESLPLERGFFVRQGTPCENASNATVSLHTGRGINAAQAFCEFTRIEKTGAHTYAATEACNYIRGGADSRQLEFTVNDRMSYSVNDAEAEWAYSARHCSQASLPEPWRSNDLSDILK